MSSQVFVFPTVFKVAWQQQWSVSVVLLPPGFPTVDCSCNFCCCLIWCWCAAAAGCRAVIKDFIYFAEWARAFEAGDTVQQLAAALCIPVSDMIRATPCQLTVIMSI